MYIKQIEIDGFKSYLRRQVVEGFDPQFNAITGLNGTGKSNILDAICFVLGITNLSCIRAQQLIDLVYKQGQAGVNKATVSIVFDNSNKKDSPMGYHACNEVVVKRQIVVNGRNTYTINGTNCSQGKVADFFRMIGLNVNNPHFLIMQGRITKVLNMKPHEILAMLEEAAGTKIYDAKRDYALDVISKKESKIAEINKMLDKDIIPTLAKLRSDRDLFIEYQGIDKLIIDNERRLNAFVYYHSKNEEERYLEYVEQELQKILNSEEKSELLKASIKELEEDYKEQEATKGQNGKNENALLTERAAAVNKDLAKAESELDALKVEEKRVVSETKRLEKMMTQDKADLETKKKSLTKLESEIGTEEEKATNASDRVTKARAQLAAVVQGMTTDQDGNTITVEAQINETKELLSKLVTNVKKDQTREKMLHPELAEKQKTLASICKRASDQGNELDQLLVEKTRLERELDSISFDQDRFNYLTQQLRRVDHEKQQAQQRLSDTLSRHGNLNFQYDRQKLPSNFDRSKVLGFAVRHLQTKDNKFNLAIEVAGGAQLTQVIVKEASISKQLIDTKGALLSRTTFIPLDKIQARTLQKQQLEAAKRIAQANGEDCWLALELIQYDEKVANAMGYIFGSTIICESKETASKITYDQKVRAKTVTLEGDSYQPSGSGSGGSRDQRHSLIATAQNIAELSKLVEEKEHEYGQIDEELHRLTPMRQRFEQTNSRFQEVNDRVGVLEVNARQSPMQVLRTEIADLEKELSEITGRLKENQAKVKEFTENVKQYEDRKKNAKQFREQAEKKAKKDLKAAEESLAALGAEAERVKETLALRREEVASLEKQIEDTNDQIAKNQEKIAELQAQIEDRNSVVATTKENAKQVKKELDAHLEEMRRQNDDLKKLANRIDKMTKECMKEENGREEYKKNVVEYKNMAGKYQRQHKEVKKEHAWIVDVEDQIGVKGTDLEFPDGYSYESEKKKIENLQERKKELSRNLNITGMNILQSAEDEVIGLQKKREILYADKKTILETIKVLDERKEKEVIRAYQKVTTEFGNIFTTLLPGAEAKLQPPAGKTPLDGLEVKVGFSGKWKESLGELSGGQRSLVALSLVLAMLKFKPAPLYILDEVDAALDLAHTQNIGVMIKKHFKASQFIIVSLKEGMFNNANVLFRTKFQNGTSQVERFTNNT